MQISIAGLIIFGLGTAACTQASASGLDPANPLHCAAQFESYSIIAKAQGDTARARGWGARSQFDVGRAKAAGIDLGEIALARVEKMILGSADGGLALASECVKRQDANPEYRRLREQN